jgi:hypothetical protein
VDEDYYIKISVSQDIISTKDRFTFSITFWAGYYNTPYWEMKGWSDAVAKLGISKEHNNISFNSGFYYGRTLSKEFMRAAGGIKNHFWCDFGINYTIGL